MRGDDMIVDRVCGKFVRKYWRSDLYSFCTTSHLAAMNNMLRLRKPMPVSLSK
jgi:hypothetical protein